MSKKNSKKKDPLKSQIMTGYMLNKATRYMLKAREYLDEAEHCLEEAYEDTNNDGTPIFYSQIAEPMRLINEAKGAAWTPEVAHEILRKLIADDYKEITDEDFKQYGAGGNKH